MAIARYGFEPKHGGFRNDDSDESDTESDDSGAGDGFDSKSKAKLDLKNKPRNKFNDNYKWVNMISFQINQSVILK